MTVLDFTLVPDEQIREEYFRRLRARGTAGGRPKKITPCPKCGQQMGARELWAHQPTCTPPQRFDIDRPKSTRKTVGDGHREYITAEGIRLTWTNARPLPKVGARVRVRDRTGRTARAAVIGYYMDLGQLGVTVKHKEQAYNLLGHDLPRPRRRA